MKTFALAGFGRGDLAGECFSFLIMPPQNVLFTVVSLFCSIESNAAAIA
jgi:hypothetical protein